MAYVDEVMADGPVCYFKFDEDTPWHNCRADSGFVLRPSAPRTSAPISGLFPGSPVALKLSGAGYLEMADPLKGVAASAIAVEAWVTRPDTNTAARSFVRGQDGAGLGWSVFLKGVFDGSVEAGIVTMSTGATSYVATSAAGLIAAGSAAHVVMNYIPGTGIRVYVNAVLAASVNFASTTLRSSTFGAAVGANALVASTDYWNGGIDDLAIYTTPLSEARITAHYAARTAAHSDSVPSYQWADIKTPRRKAPAYVTAPVPPFNARRGAALLSVRDMEFGGPGRIWGTTKIKGISSKVPTKARVVLMHQRSKQLVRETWSDPTTGYFVFDAIDTAQQFITYAEDAAGNFLPVAANRLAPKVP